VRNGGNPDHGRQEGSPVEDEAAIRQTAVLALERAGFQVTEVGHDEQAERASTDGLPDLILLDRMNAVMAVSSSRGRRKWRRCGAGQRR
jgi:DNA-binding response OmpR family regulator